METNGKKLRQALEKENFFLLPGVYDCLSAKMAEKAGFDAVFFSGGAYSLADMGRPDIGFFHTGEVLHALFSILSTIHVPLLMDADNGFGNAIHAADTAKKLEMLGVAGLQIDDQVLPRSILSCIASPHSHCQALFWRFPQHTQIVIPVLPLWDQTV